ncbi:hypothetical protein P4S72_06030 [Vibrio sp. PP-XX7]
MTLQRKLYDTGKLQGMPLTAFSTPFELPMLQERMQWHKYQHTDLGMMWLRQVFKQAVIRYSD